MLCEDIVRTRIAIFCSLADQSKVLFVFVFVDQLSVHVW